jgi:hypothetical protein
MVIKTASAVTLGCAAAVALTAGLCLVAGAIIAFANGGFEVGCYMLSAGVTVMTCITWWTR